MREGWWDGHGQAVQGLVGCRKDFRLLGLMGNQGFFFFFFLTRVFFKAS